MSPPTSPLRPAPPISALPSIPHSNSQVHVEPKPSSPTEPSAPPASPTLLASFPPSLVKNSPPQSHPAALPASIENIQTQPEDTGFYFEAAPAPTAPLPENPQTSTDLNTASRVHTELVSDTGYKVQAVLVEEDEEEDEEEHEEHKPETQPKPCAVTTEPAKTEAEEEDEEEAEEKEEEKEEKEEQELEDNREEEEKVEEREEQVVEDKKEEEEEKVEEEEEEEVDELKQEIEPASVEEPEEMTQDEEEVKEDGERNNQSQKNQCPDELEELEETEEEPAFTDAEFICQEIKHETVILSTNGITNGDDTEEQNGIVESLSPADTEFNTSETTVCYNLHSTAEEDDIIEYKEQEISENGQEVLAEQQMCVRALYDYQAEDESEISFEPGDIIRDVETVDKAWWRGWSKDGRQGLFPANYVETI